MATNTQGMDSHGNSKTPVKAAVEGTLAPEKEAVVERMNPTVPVSASNLNGMNSHGDTVVPEKAAEANIDRHLHDSVLMTLSNETRMTTESELIFSPERLSSNGFDVFSSKKASRRGATLNKPPKPVSCRVFRYFTPAAAVRPSNAVSVSTNSYGVAMESPFYTKSDTSTYWDQCFEHLECLGRGSFAEVYKVRHKEDNQLYAIKRSLTKFRGKSDRDQKLKEVRFHETLATHRNILKIVRAWEERERLYIQTELCESNLLEYAAEHPMTQPMTWHFLFQISQALDFLHSLYYVHMDVKPENVLITNDGILKLCDFGIVHDLRSASTLAQDGDARYLAFEVLSGTISPAADVFSLGMAALELVSDYDMPVTGDLWTDIRESKLPLEVTSVLTDMQLKNLLLRMIHADYKVRPSAKEVLDSPTIRDQICHMPSPFAFNQHRFEHILSANNGNDSPASHGCRTPIKKPKRPPNYVGYHDELSDDEFRIHSIPNTSRLTPPPPAIAGDPLRVRLFPSDSDEELPDDQPYFRKSPGQFRFDSSEPED